MDDYLKLAGQSLRTDHTIIFTGPSGAGKSTYLNWLEEQHPAFVAEPVTHVWEGRPLQWPDLAHIETQWVFVDELLTMGDLLHVRRLVSRGHRVVAASHLPVLAHRLIFPFSLRIFDLGRHTGKLAAELTRSGFNAQPDDVHRFVSKHGASFTALRRVLDECPPSERRFGAALNHFERYCTVRTVRETF
ncbi:MAG: hypothetical protein AAFY73_12830 [Pseudomonadota bacterium]